MNYRTGLDPRVSAADYSHSVRHAALLRRVREAILYVAAAILLALILVATLVAIALVTEPRPAAGATDRPGRPAYVCRRKLAHVSPWRTDYVRVCSKVQR